MTTPTQGEHAQTEALRFTKKPVTIEAIQWTGKNLREVITFTDGPPDTRSTHAGMAWEAYADLVARDGLKIYTLEGKMLASPGDWIIRGVKGEYYPCKPDIFEATYNPAAQVAAQPAAAPQGVAYAELDDDQIMNLAGSSDTALSDSRPLGQQWAEICNLVRSALRASHGQAPAAQEHPWGCRANAFGACSCRQAPAGATFQKRVSPWLLECFGAEIAADRVERNHRFLEESLELVQALGCTASEAHQLVDYVFGRPVGDPPQEVGGVMVTLAALCFANGLDMHEAGEVELGRISAPELVAKIRAKQAAKPKHSPLPEAPTAQAAPAAEYDHDPQSTTVEEAARHVGKWLNERPNRPLDLRDVAMLVAHAQAPAAGAVAGPNWRELLQDLEWSAGGYNRSGDGESMCPCCEQWKSEGHTSDCRLATMLAAAPTPAAQADSQPAPVDMVLHCPACGLQHIDAADQPVTVLEAVLRANPLAMPAKPRWDNPPHRSHLCHGCGHIWRPADVPTNGVAAVKTTGKADSPIAASKQGDA